MMILKLCSLLLLLTVHAYGHEGHDHGEDAARSCTAHEKSMELMESNAVYKRNFNKQVKHSLKNQKKMREFRADLRKNKNKYSEFERRRLVNSNSYDVVTIPVVFHVLYTNSNENLSDKQLESQIDVLNKDFRGTNKEMSNGAVDSMWNDRLGDSKLEFSLAQTKRKQISSASVCQCESCMKKSSSGGSSSVDPETYLNIWICPFNDGLLGYAYYPCLLGDSDEWKDGVVITSDAVGSRDDNDGSFYFGGYSFDLGRTGTHEVGHYLNLAHVWGNYGGCSNDDGVDDTPVQYTSNGGCPSGTDSCDSTDPLKGYDIRDNYENYMDYSNDACMFMFTDEQVDRMRAVVSSSGCRSTMYNNGVGNGGGSGDDDSDSDDSDSDDSGDTTDDGEFYCNNGCSIPAEWQNDDYCDCTSCEDENSWTCSSCGGCPSGCDDYVECEEQACPDGYFCCDSGCQISASWENDNYCDCPNCEDESSHTCSSCVGTSSNCVTCDVDDYQWCGNSRQAEEIISQHKADIEDDESFICNDGCEIESDWQNDNYCDCQECEDEDFWTCNNCYSTDAPDEDEFAGCSNECGEYRFCDKFICSNVDDDGNTCVVEHVHIDNGWCDCPDCSDETDYTCDTCGGCPDTCVADGGYAHQCDRTASGDGENGNTDYNTDAEYARDKEKELAREYGNGSKNNSDENGAIIAVAVVASILVVAIGVAIFIVWRKRSKAQISFRNSSVSKAPLLSGDTIEQPQGTIGVTQQETAQ